MVTSYRHIKFLKMKMVKGKQRIVPIIKSHKYHSFTALQNPQTLRRKVAKFLLWSHLKPQISIKLRFQLMIEPVLLSGPRRLVRPLPIHWLAHNSAPVNPNQYW